MDPAARGARPAVGFSFGANAGGNSRLTGWRDSRRRLGPAETLPRAEVQWDRWAELPFASAPVTNRLEMSPARFGAPLPIHLPQICEGLLGHLSVSESHRLALSGR
jgi:hypothetical protein